MLSFNAPDCNFGNNQYIAEQVKVNDHAALMRKGSQILVYHYSSERSAWAVVGRISSKNPIAQAMMQNNVKCLNNLFVSDIVVWTYEDTVNTYNKDNSKDFRPWWQERSRNQGYVYVVVVSGFGQVEA